MKKRVSEREGEEEKGEEEKEEGEEDDTYIRIASL